MRFNLKHLFAILAVIGLLLPVILIVFSPVMRLSTSIDEVQHRIINDLDHAMIRDTTLPFLENSTERFIEPGEWPPEVAATAPKSIFVSKGQVFIEYGGGLAHFGLVIDPKNGQQTERTEIISGVYFYETE